MLREEIRFHLEQLHIVFGRPYQLMHSESLRKLCKSRDHSAILDFIAKSIPLETTVSLEYESNCGPRYAVARVLLPTVVPHYDTKAFKESIFPIYVQERFLAEAPVGSIVCVLAHEVSHIVLPSRGFELPCAEELVDLAAMWFGYRTFFLKYSSYTFQRSRPICELSWQDSVSKFFETSYEDTARKKLGYLTQSNRRYAANLMKNN